MYAVTRVSVEALDCAGELQKRGVLFGLEGKACDACSKRVSWREHLMTCFLPLLFLPGLWPCKVEDLLLLETRELPQLFFQR